MTKISATEMLSENIKEIIGSFGKLHKVVVRNRKDEKAQFVYSIHKIAAKGTFGVVCLIETPEKQNFALKVVYQDFKYHNRELEILSNISHPNIIELKHYFLTGLNSQGYFLNAIFEYIPTTLEEFFKNKTHDIELLKELYRQAASALEYLHNLKICHRDLKPSNILIKDNILKICDFGSAKYFEESQPNISYICSRYYRSPENLFGQTDYTFKIDVWSLALVFCESRLDQPLFVANSSIDMLKVIFKTIYNEEDISKVYIDNEFLSINFKTCLLAVFVDKYFVECIYRSLKINPYQRFSASDILRVLNKSKI